MALRATRQRSAWIATLRLSCNDVLHAQDIQLVQSLRWQLFGIKLGVYFLREPATQFTVQLLNVATAPKAVSLTLLPTPFFIAALGIYLQNRAAFWNAFRGVSGFWTTRLRKAVANAASKGQQIEADYNVWTWHFDSWTKEHLASIADKLALRPTVNALVFCATGNEDALAATLASVYAQRYPVADIIVGRPGDTLAVKSAAASDYVAVLQAGELMPPHSLLLLIDELGRQDADALFADEDSIGLDGVRADPWFKPQPSLTMMCSGLLSRGVWLIRSTLLEQSGTFASAQDWAACVQLAVWFTLYQQGRADRVRRLPRVLTHRRANAETAPPVVLGELIDLFLRRLGVRATVTPEFPLRLRWHPDITTNDKVSLIVPSRLRGDVQLRCLLDILHNTTYRNFEMLVVVTQLEPLDEAQKQNAARLAEAGPARVEILRQQAFNYPLANNFGASRTDGAFLCLLNDDVATIARDWLDRMVAIFSDKNVGIVGAKLYFPDMTTQHGGVIMGLAGLADHAHRFLPRGEPGYMWRGVLDQELSVVTGACLLVPRNVFDLAGGLDETLPTGFNDVDFCLRVRALNYSVVMAASIELVHYETLTFGHHYAGAEDRELADVALMQKRWRAVCEIDPFHNPNLSLAAQKEWALASPPRLSLGSHTIAFPS